MADRRAAKTAKEATAATASVTAASRTEKVVSEWGPETWQPDFYTTQRSMLISDGQPDKVTAFGRC